MASNFGYSSFKRPDWAVIGLALKRVGMVEKYRVFFKEKFWLVIYLLAFLNMNIKINHFKI